MGDPFTTKASAIMDEACLGEPFVSNGVVAALRASIESALRSAAAEEREACASVADDWFESSSGNAGEMWVTSKIAKAIRSRGITND